MVFLTSAEIAPVEASRTVINLNSYKRFIIESDKNNQNTSVNEVLTPEDGLAVLLSSTRTCPAGNSFPKKSLVSLAKSLNLAKQIFE